MWDLNTIISMNATKQSAAQAPTHGPTLRIYDLGENENGERKFALGNKGQKAVYVVRRILNRTDKLGRGLPRYLGVQARRPTIPADAPVVPRESAGRLLLKALGLRA